MELTNNTAMPFSLYELYKETVEGKVSTNHSQLIKSFKTALGNLSEVEQSTILWDEKTFQLPNQPKPTTTIVMDKRTALWFSAKLNDSTRWQPQYYLGCHKQLTLTEGLKLSMREFNHLVRLSVKVINLVYSD